MLRVGIVGCGKIADGHVEQVRATGRAEVVAVCDREPLMSEQLGIRLDIANRYTDLDEMLKREALDVVHVATPPDSHRVIALQAFASGCHVFMEKPFALTAAEAKIILDAAAQAGKRVCVNYLYNFESPALQFEEMVRKNALGSIVHLDTCYGYNLAGDYGSALMSDPSHWVHKLPGKLFHNVLDHVLAKIAPFISDDFELSAMAFRRRSPIGDVAVDAMPDELRFILKSGAVTASGLVSAHARPVAQILRVIGTRDTVEIDYANRTIVRALQQTQPSAIGRQFPAWQQARRFASNGWRNAKEFSRYEFHYFQGMRVLLNRYYDAIQNGAPDPIPLLEILRVCTLIDCIVAETQVRNP